MKVKIGLLMMFLPAVAVFAWIIQDAIQKDMVAEMLLIYAGVVVAVVWFAIAQWCLK